MQNSDIALYSPALLLNIGKTHNIYECDIPNVYTDWNEM